MIYQESAIAFILTNTYNLSPPRKVGPARLRLTDPGKYEPSHDSSAQSRHMVVAHWFDKTNILIRYSPEEFSP